MKRNVSADIIVIGAGATGLMASRELAQKNFTVIVLEARKRTGGRICTTTNDFPAGHKEEGAEFIHGEQPLTSGMLMEAGLDFHAIAGEMWRADETGLNEEEEIIEGWPEFMKKLNELTTDISISEFLNRNFPEEKYSRLRRSVINYAEGYDTAETGKASALALGAEWKESADMKNYRIAQGYSKLMQWLETDCLKYGCKIHLASIVSVIKWQKGNVIVTTTTGQTYECKKVIATVPLGVLRSDEDIPGSITFTPALPEHKKAAKELGFGSVIKILLHFKKRFWEEIDGMNDAGFIFSDAAIPTWWTQNPEKSALLTGWLGGPKAAKISLLSKEEILLLSVTSVAQIFARSTTDINEMLDEWDIINWTSDPFTRGSYSYATVAGSDWKKILSTPVSDTIYFAGEALGDDAVAGTVEAALQSGRDVAERITNLRG